MGAHRSDERGDWLQEDPAEQHQHQLSSNPWNIMIKHRQVHRRGRRSQMAVSFTDPVISMDLLRSVLQPSINEDIQAVISKYMKFFQKAASNVKENVGDEVQADQLIRDTCRSCLEHAKQLYPDSDKPSVKPPIDGLVMKRSKQIDEESSQRGSPIQKKRKGRPPGPVISFDRVAPVGFLSKPKVVEPLKRDGPKWDPTRLSENTTFVLGSRANKALGMGGTRGRIYIKHADLFKYAADPQDKHWLAERQHMRATGGKMAYLLIEEDVLDLAQSDDYRDCPELKLDELKPFRVPIWMIEKMQKTMDSMRTEKD
ncbi:deoxynucleotidyltransferase terminal-interacting protein 1 isoform X1 [Polypterus senegalus]|uniref:deoxynucleotidyltransferase terminal-interacting protein 1 isoform X1 n=1 Tax=Polypterus senegalus TaxID=55291 RepID=UPI0019666CE3|nr:deoxynucleotidyltransferase terminal-interacting protein 1 isoform X1 [Polypterus senegalus]